MSKQKKEPKRKLPPGVDESYAQDIESQSTDTLKAKVVELQNQLEDAEEFKKSEAYVQAKAEWDLTNGPTQETIRHIKGKTKFVVQTLKAKGAM